MKFVKKRKREQPASENTDEAIVEKKKKDEFTEIEFKLMLRDPNRIFHGLEKFIEKSRQYNNDEYDIVLHYCQSTSDCSEILQLLEVRKRNSTEWILILGALECILIRIAGDLDKYRTLGQVVVQQLAASHLSQICYSLNMSNKSKQIKVALKLLIAMVMIGGSSCRAVISQFNFNHENILPLFNRRDRKDNQDVRTCLVHFVMSFLLVGDGGVIRKLVEQKTMLQGVLKGLTCDKLSTIQVVIPTVLEKVIQNPSISKTSKVQLFSENVLKQMSSLYYWQGPCSWRNANDKISMRISREDKCSHEDSQLVAQMIHTLFLDLCCSFRNGICFFDKTFGTSGKNQNSLLTKLFTFLVKNLDNSLSEQLCVKFLQTCPDQLQFVLSSMESSLSPRPSSRWVSSVEFLKKVYAAQPECPPVLAHCDGISPEKLAAMVTVFVLPPDKVFHSLSHSLKHKSAVVRCKLLELLKLLVQRSSGILQHCTIAAASSVRGNENYWNNVSEVFRTALLKCVPDESELFTCWKLFASPNPEDKDQDQDLPAAEPLDQLILLEQVSCLYQELYPSLLTENHQNLTLLLDTVREYSKDISHEEDKKRVLPQLYLLKLLAVTDARKLPWSKTLKDGHTLMYLLLDMMFLVQHNDQLKQMTQRLVCKLLVKTNLFEGTEKELEIWFHHFSKQLEHDNSTEVLKFMSQILTTFLSNPFPYIDKVTELLAESTSQLDTSSPADTRSVGTAESAIDAILEMDEEDFLMLDHSSIIKNDIFQSSPKLPFSPVVLISLENFSASEDLKKSSALQSFLCTALLDIFHTQLDPVPLSLLLEQYQCVLENRSEILYIMSWSPNTKVVSWKPSKEMKQSKSLSELLMCVQASDFVMNSKFEQRLNSSVSSLVQQKSVNITQQILLLVRKIIDDRFEQMYEKSQELLKMLFGLLKNIKDNLLKLTEKTTICNKLSEMKEFDLLDAAEMTADESLAEVINTVLKHPYIEKWFLFNRSIMNSTKLKPSSEKILSQLVTENFIQLLDNFPSSLSSGVNRYLKTYCDKINNALDTIQTGKSSMYECSVVLKSMAVIVKHVVYCQQIKSLNTLLDFSISYLISDGKIKKLSKAGKLVVQLATATISDKEKVMRQGKQLSLKKMATIFDLLTVAPDSSLEDYCCQVLKMEESYTIVVSKDLFSGLLGELSEKRIQIIQSVLIHNVACRLLFENWITENENNKDKLLLAKLVKVYLMTLKEKSQYEAPDTKACLDTIRRIYMKKKTDIISENSVCLEIIHLLMKIEVLDDATLLNIWNTISQAVESGSSVKSEHVNMIDLVYKRLSLTDPSCNKEQVLFLLMKILKNSAARKTERNVMFEDNLLSLIKQLLQSGMSLVDQEIKVFWSQFVKMTLKSLYLNPGLLNILSHILPLVYTESGDISLPLKSLHEMVMTHSQFLTVMFGDHNDGIKESLVSLLVDLVERCPECCSSSHCGLLLGSYNASLSFTDQKILKLIYLYDLNGKWLEENRPFLWGPKAIENYSARKNLGLSLWKHPSMEQTIDNLDVKKMYQSILHFPLRRNIVPDRVGTVEELQSEADVYDPCFLLPLFSIILSPDVVVNCRKFVENHCLGYTFAALSSHVSDVRRAAYHVLAEFTSHLEGSPMKEKVQIMCILDLLRNSCQEANVKLACIITVFLAKAARLQLNTGEHMYRVINSFLTIKPDLDITNVPEFYKLFRSSVLEFREDRSWILSLLVDGLRDTADYRVMERRFTFKLLLTLHDSALSDNQCQVQVLKIVKSACSVKTVASDLVKTHGLVTWLHSVILSMKPEKEALIADILHTLWFTLLAQWKTSSEEKQKNVLPLKLSRELLLCVKSFIQNCGNCSKTALLHLLEVMISTIHNINTVTGKLHAQGHLVDLETVTLKDVCFILLHGARHLHQNDIITYTTNIINHLGYEPNSVVQVSSKTDRQRHKFRIQKAEEKITEDGDEGQKAEDSPEPERDLEKESVSPIQDQRSDNMRQLLLKTAELCFFWNPDNSDDIVTQKQIVAGILMTASWCMRKSYVLDKRIRYLLLKWITKHFSSESKFSELCIDTLLSGSKFAVRVLNEMLGMYACLFTEEKYFDVNTTVKEITKENKYLNSLALLNSIVFPLFKTASRNSANWDELKCYVTRWKDVSSINAQEQLSLAMKEFLMELQLTVQPDPILRWSSFFTSDNTFSTNLENCQTSDIKSQSASYNTINTDNRDDDHDDEEMMSDSETEVKEKAEDNLTKIKIKSKTNIKKKCKRVFSKSQENISTSLVKRLRKRGKVHKLK